MQLKIGYLFQCPPWVMLAKNKVALKGQKLCIQPGILKLLPLQGDKFASVITQGDALG